MAIQEHVGGIVLHASGALKEGMVFAKEFLDNLFRREMSLDEIAKVYNDELDKVIVDETVVKGNVYVGGEFHIKYVSDDLFSTSFEMYFQNKSKQWIKKSSESKPQSVKYLDSDARQELSLKKDVKYEIESPEELISVAKGNMSNAAQSMSPVQKVKAVDDSSKEEVKAVDDSSKEEVKAVDNSNKEEVKTTENSDKEGIPQRKSILERLSDQQVG